MYFSLSAQQENELLNKPETGMGYQIIEASREGNYTREKFLVLNSEIIIQINGYESEYVKKILNEGIALIKLSTSGISLHSISVLPQTEFRNVLNERKSEKETGATESPVENADGIETFVRLSAFFDDKRIDKIRRCLRPGSFTTTMNDYRKCKEGNDDPVQRYALPSDEQVKHAFHIRSAKSDTLQRGTVQPANEKRGGGKEVYFDKGTATGTFILQTAY